MIGAIQPIHSYLRRNHETLELCKYFLKSAGVHSANYMVSAGFQYTNVKDTARCDQCQLEVSDWSKDMIPFHVHAERSPMCPFVCSIRPSYINSAFYLSSESITKRDSRDSKLYEQEKIFKHQNMKVSSVARQKYQFKAIEIMEQARNQTFSHWPQQSSTFTAKLIHAGFFSCNVSDRVICLYCNLVIQQWKTVEDDPCEIHKILSPKCHHVINKLERNEMTSPEMVSEDIIADPSKTETNKNDAHSNSVLVAESCYTVYSDVVKRQESFVDWPYTVRPTVDELVRAGFFYSSVMNRLICFYCHGSLQPHTSDEDPIIEHVKSYPFCDYAKQICGDEVYRKIQESTRHARERTQQNSFGNSQISTIQRLYIPDDATLSRYVAARLDLPVSQRLLDQNFKLSIIKRCWQEQLRLKYDDFNNDYDLWIACIILQKQIECIDGKQENIIVPSVRMRQILASVHSETTVNSSLVPSARISDSMTSLNSSNIEMTASSNVPSIVSHSTDAIIAKTEKIKSTKSAPVADSSQPLVITTTTLANPCLLCMGNERQLACIPCGHLVACISCKHRLKLCPICQREIQALIRVFM